MAHKWKHPGSYRSTEESICRKCGLRWKIVAKQYGYAPPGGEFTWQSPSKPVPPCADAPAAERRFTLAEIEAAWRAAQSTTDSHIEARWANFKAELEKT